MKKSFHYIVFCFFCLFLFSQETTTNSIKINAKLNTKKNTIEVHQTVIFHNTTHKELKKLYFTIGLNGYSSKHSKLTQAQLEKRKTKLYFQRNKNRGGIHDLDISEAYQFLDYDILEIFLKQPLTPSDSISISFQYNAKIPDYNITHYGKKENYYHLKDWFFTIPAFKNEKQTVYSNKNFDDEFNSPTSYSINLEYPSILESISNLEIQNSHFYTGKTLEPVEILLKKDSSKESNKSFYSTILKKSNGTNLLVESEIKIDSKIAKKELEFLENHLGSFTPTKILLTNENKRKNAFVGIDDISGYGINIKLFPKEIQDELNLFNQLSNQFIRNKVLLDKRKNHWILNGTKVYMQMKYLQTYYPDLKLLGDAPEKFKLLWTHPLKAFHASKLNLQDRYYLMNLFVVRKNVDQKITTPLDSLRNLNHFIISGVQTGIGFNYLNDYTHNSFDKQLKEFYTTFDSKLATEKDFEKIIKNSNSNIDWFFSEYLNSRKPYDFQLKKFKPLDSDSIQLIIKNKFNSKGPFKISAYKNDTLVYEKWAESKDEENDYYIPKDTYTSIQINEKHIVPEINDLNNNIVTTGIFKNKKKPQLKFLMDVQNPKYAQLFYQPILNWNNYDGLLLGLRLYNSTLINKRLHFAISPQYSLGTNSLTGSLSANYSIYPRNETSIFERIRFGGGLSYFHYDKDLAYTQASPSISFKFKRRYPRQEINNILSFRINYLDKETPFDIPFNEDEYKYNIFNPIFTHSNHHKINELSYLISLHQNKTFGKIFGSAYYRKRFSPKKIFGARIFGGYFYQNNTISDYFDFGLNRVNDYMFDYDLYGRSEASGFLSQEFVLAEGGFKTNFQEKANQWMVTTNLEADVWWRFSIYSDFGIFKNKNQSSKFRYDSGVRLKLIPDFLEFYFPIQSTLGFEPSMDNDYSKQIRFVFKPNFGKAISYLRRGWY